MTEAERRAALEQVAAEVRDCTRCRLHEGRSHAVPGEGHPSTEVLLVGEAPGLNEDRGGRPFVGAAGQFLTELLGSVGWRREDVFITNVVKCRPPGNRDPEPDEIESCAPFLRRQLDALDPALVVTLGRHSMGRFLPGTRIGQIHGTYRPGPAECGAERSLVFAMYHPAAALHQGSLRQTLLDDMAQVPAALLEARRQRRDRAGEVTTAIDEPASVLTEPAVAPTELSVAAETGPTPSAPELEPAPAPAPAPAADPAPEPTPAPEAIAIPIDAGSAAEPVGLAVEPAATEPEPEPELALLVAVAAAAVPGDILPDDQMTLF